MINRTDISTIPRRDTSLATSTLALEVRKTKEIEPPESTQLGTGGEFSVTRWLSDQLDRKTTQQRRPAHNRANLLSP